MDIQKCQPSTISNTPVPTQTFAPFDINTVNDSISNTIPYEIPDDDNLDNEDNDSVYGEEMVNEEEMESYPTIIPDFHPILQEEDSDNDSDSDNVLSESSDYGSQNIMPRYTSNTSVTSTVQHPFPISNMTSSPSKNDFLTNNTTHPSLYNYTP